MEVIERTQAYPDIVAPDEPVGAYDARPFIPASVTLPELTPLPLIVGTLLGMVFGASSLYLVLKVGLTVSASIPVAVISVTLFRLLARLGHRGASILEHNIVQSAGSAGESIAFGVGVTMPAILILGFDLEVTRVILVGVLGGTLGILMMIPLRRALIVEQHGRLKYPEGTACAEVLKAAATPAERRIAAEARGEAESADIAAGAATIFAGFGVGLAYKVAMTAFHLWKDVPEKVLGAPLRGGSLSAEISPELLGVGYIIGPRIASTMCAGGVLAYLVLIPAIIFFGGGAVLAPGTTPMGSMSPDEVRGAYVLYIGAGAVAAGGIISLFRSLPMIWRGIAGGVANARSSTRASVAAARPRTDRDLPLGFVAIGCVLLVAAILLARPFHMNLLGAILILLFGFLFVTVSSRLTGEIGSSSNPISGMTVATLLLTCLIFVLMGWIGTEYRVAAVSIAGIVCVAASNGGTTSQDLKTGYLIGATPKSQQLAILIGSLCSALVLGPILLALNTAGTVYAPVAPAQGAHVTVAPAALAALPVDHVAGPQAPSDRAAYRAWHKPDDAVLPAGRYLIDDAGHPRYLVDPGINGTHRERPDGTHVAKFDAPKATLISYIIKGILGGQLPWTLVLLGVGISIVLEMAGVQSLAFAVGVYLPLSSSTPILFGGLVRWYADRRMRARHGGKVLTEEELVAEGDRGPGVLMASGYIAGGAIAGVVIAFLAGVLSGFNERVTNAMTAGNPFFAGVNADLLSMLPFAGLMGLLTWVAARRLG